VNDTLNILIYTLALHDALPIFDMVKAINYSADADFVDAVSRYLDLKLYLTHVATENVLAEIDGIWDGVYGTNNIYLYRFEVQDRSEEHTSELQSRVDLVCRLLL